MGITIPKYDSQVGTAPLPGARVSADANPAAYGRVTAPLPDLSGVTRVVDELHQKAAAEADQLAVLHADNQLDTLQRQIEQQARDTYTGQRALEATPKALTQWDTDAAKIGDTMQTPRQRVAFEQRLLARRQELAGGLDRWADAEHTRFRDQTFGAALDARVNAAVGTDDPTQRATALAEGRAILTDYARQAGWAPEVLQQKTGDFTSKIHLGVLDRLLTAGDDRTAEAYYAANKAQIDGADRGRVEQALEVSSTRRASQIEADRITASASTLTAALQLVRAIDDPKLRDAVHERVRQAFAEREVAERDAREARLLDATNRIERSGSFDAIPPQLLTQLTLGERSALRGYAMSLARGEPVSTDLPTYYMLKTTAADPRTRQDFLGLPLLAFRDKLSTGDLRELIDLQAGLRKGDANATNEADGYLSDSQVVDGMYEQAVGKPPTNDTKAQQRMASYQRAVDVEAQRFNARTGRKPSNEELRGIAATLLVEARLAGTGVFANDTRRVFEAQAGDRLVLTIRDVPGEARRAIEARLRQQGRPVTDQAVLAAFTAGVSQRIPAGEAQP